MNKKLWFLILLFSLTIPVCGQQNQPEKDSARAYKKIEDFSRKSKFGTFLHKLLFKSTRKKTTSKIAERRRYQLKKAFDKHEGKIIRNIYIETLDPFSFSVSDENAVPDNGIEKFGNSLHLKTKKWTVKDILLFQKNDPLDSLIVKESERLIRRRRFARSVIIKPVPIANNKDSVDVSVRVLDSWSLIPTGSISTSRGNFELTERNFLGLGHELENNFLRRFSDGENAYTARYSINNIKNTFINTTFNYSTSFEDNITKSVRAERTFFSPFTRLAGGVFLENRVFIDSLPAEVSSFEKFNFKNETRDFWFGHSFQVFKGKNEDFRTTNLITSVGYKNVNYIKSPNMSFDSEGFFSDEELYLASIGLNTRKFAEEKNLFNYGIIEDVPYGQVFSITGGFQNKNQIRRSYFGTRIAHGGYFSLGYFAVNLEWGSFFNSGKSEQTTLKAEVCYFTNLIPIGSWQIRQFMKTGITVGNNRLPIIKDRVTLEESNGISGFTNPLLNGTKKLVFSLQTQTYSPGSWHGFRFSPFLNASFGLLGNENNSFFDKTLYSKFSLGVLINNDYLVFNSFQLSLSYYPSIPFEGNNILKTNSFENTDYTIPDYEIGQPIITDYK